MAFSGANMNLQRFGKPSGVGFSFSEGGPLNLRRLVMMACDSVFDFRVLPRDPDYGAVRVLVHSSWAFSDYSERFWIDLSSMPGERTRGCLVGGWELNGSHRSCFWGGSKSPSVPRLMASSFFVSTGSCRRSVRNSTPQSSRDPGFL
nr:hypothetical protein Iba_chr03dCG1360 [Ipomoea batatas]